VRTIAQRRKELFVEPHCLDFLTRGPTSFAWHAMLACAAPSSAQAGTVIGKDGYAAFAQESA
jgi:hypothetical protein